MTAPGVEVATLKIAMQLAAAPLPMSARELVRQHQQMLDGLEIENHAAAYQVADWLENLAARDLVAIVPPAQKRGPTRYQWLGAIRSVPTRHSSTGANP
jgi:hypothetical protein